VEEDASRYQVTLRRPGTDETWTGEVIGPSKVFPLDTVNVLTASKQVIVFDKHNKKLWQNSLNYNVIRGLDALDEESATYGQGPCVERKGVLYIFDEGVLTAFDLATGNVRWRLPSVGIAGLFFDDDDNIYVNTTTASPDSIKYSRQIDISDKVRSVVMKVDPKKGQVLWSVEPGGLVNHVYDKVILVAQSYSPVDEDNDGPTAGFATPAHLRIRRINARNGHEVWEYFQQRAPLDIGFEKNTIRLVFRKEVQVLKFATF
jgi:outer membrane protein assembly factor BamB